MRSRSIAFNGDDFGVRKGAGFVEFAGGILGFAAVGIDVNLEFDAFFVVEEVAFEFGGGVLHGQTENDGMQGVAFACARFACEKSAADGDFFVVFTEPKFNAFSCACESDRFITIRYSPITNSICLTNQAHDNGQFGSSC